MLDRYVGSLLSCCFSRKNSPVGQHIGRVLFIRPGGIGDAVLLLPALETLARCMPGVDIEVLAERRNAEVFTWCPAVSKIWCYDHLSDLLRVLQKKYDVVIDTEQWYRLSAVVARLIRAPRIIGFAGNNRERMLTDAIPYDLFSYEASTFCSLLAPLGIDHDFAGLSRLVLMQTMRDQSLKLLRSTGDRAFIALFPGASAPEKIWPVERFVLVAEYARFVGFIPVVVGGKGEFDAGEQIIGDGVGVNLAGRTTLSETAAVLSRATAFVSGDSGLLHIAAALDVPLVALFGPSNAKKWGPQGDKCKIVRSSLGCAPCSKYGTIADCKMSRCMDVISVKEVTSVLADLDCK